jgi:hypothetical protein
MRRARTTAFLLAIGPLSLAAAAVARADIPADYQGKPYKDRQAQIGAGRRPVALKRGET